jgi:hypothetical protein
MGYWSSPSSTTVKPNIHAGACMNKKLIQASLILSLGTNKSNRINEITHTEASMRMYFVK